MLYHPATAEYARRVIDERLAAAERRHRLFRQPITDFGRTSVAEVIPMPTIPSTYPARVA